jgi:bifunctional non-homologous end joining protein LigD
VIGARAPFPPAIHSVSSDANLTPSRTRIPSALPYIHHMRWRSSTSVIPAKGFIEPCIPTKVLRPPTGDYVWEVKLDGYRLRVRKDAGRVRIYSRRGADFTPRFPRIVEAVRRMKVTSILLDGEGIVYDAKGMPNFTLITLSSTTAKCLWSRSTCSN